MTAKTTYTPAQVSEMLDIPPSSLRRYARIYAQFLSETARTSDKKRRYTGTDVLILRKIKLYSREKRTPEAIMQAILLVDETDEPQDEPAALALLPQITAEFENLRAQLAQLEQARQADRGEIDELRRQLEELKKPWYQRLFKKPP